MALTGAPLSEHIAWAEEGAFVGELKGFMALYQAGSRRFCPTKLRGAAAFVAHSAAHVAKSPADGEAAGGQG